MQIYLTCVLLLVDTFVCAFRHCICQSIYHLHGCYHMHIVWHMHLHVYSDVADANQYAVCTVSSTCTFICTETCICKYIYISTALHRIMTTATTNDNIKRLSEENNGFRGLEPASYHFELIMCYLFSTSTFGGTGDTHS